MDRAPGLSVRLKLTLSYAGFLMLAGGLLLAAVWVFLLRYVPDPDGLERTRLLRSHPLRPPGRLRSEGGPRAGVPARVRSPGRVASRRPHARPPDPHHQRHPHGRDRIPRPPDPAARPQRRVPRARRRLRHHARAPRSTRRRTAAVRSQRLPRAAHPAGGHADAARRRPQRSEPRQRRARRPPPRRQRPSDRPHRSTAPAQPRRPAVLLPGDRRPVAHRGGSHGDAPPPRRDTRRHHRDLRRRDPHPRLTRPPAADGDEPRAQRDRPQPARAGRRVGHDQRSPGERGAHRREHRREAHPAAGLHARRAVPARQQRIRTDHAGVGLGLAIVKSIAQAHDGTLTLTPRADGGLRVTVELPAAPS